MSHLHLLIPDALVASDFAPDLLRGLTLPHLDLLAAHGSDAPRPPVPDHLCPWQAWLLHGEPGGNIAEAWAAGFDVVLEPSQTVWLGEPVHLEVGLDHLVLTDPQALAITPDEAAALADAAVPLLAEAGWQLDLMQAHYWLLRRTGPLDLIAPTAECAIGGPVGPWLPADSGSGAALQWQRLANEIQMTWHTHEVNQRREEAGRPTINALWLAGTGRTGTDLSGLRRYGHIDSALPLLRLFANQATGGARKTTLRTWDSLIHPVRAEDWSSWRNAIQALEVHLGPTLDDLRRNRLDDVTLILCGRRELRVLTVRGRDLWKFWRRGRAVDLFADASP